MNFKSLYILPLLLSSTHCLASDCFQYPFEDKSSEIARPQNTSQEVHELQFPLDDLDDLDDLGAREETPPHTIVKEDAGSEDVPNGKDRSVSLIPLSPTLPIAITPPPARQRVHGW